MIERQRTVQSRGQAWCVAVGILVTLAITGCDQDWAKRLDTGRILPNIRFEVALDTPARPVDLYPRFESLSREEGFVTYVGQPPNELFEATSGTVAFRWRHESPTAPLWSVDFFWIVDSDNATNKFTVALNNNGMDDFEQDDWEIFADWRDRVLPGGFPDAKIEVIGHPARFSDPSKVSKLLQLTRPRCPGE